MNFKIFSNFEAAVKKKFKSNNDLINVTIAAFLDQSLNAISITKNSDIFNVFHTKSSRANYIASELVLQYLEKRRMKITIQCAKKETLSKYFRKHSDKWLQRELQLRTRMDLFSILISDWKKEMISTNVLKSNKKTHNSSHEKSKNSKEHSENRAITESNNEPSSSSITPSPTPSPSPKNSCIAEFPISKSSESVSSKTNSQNSPKSKHSKILNVTEMSSGNQFYYQKNIFDENEKNKEKYSVSEVDKYKTLSTTDKSKIPRFQQLKKVTYNTEPTKKVSPTSNSVKEKQVTFVDQNQNQILANPKSSFNNKSNAKIKSNFASEFDTNNNQKPNFSSLIINTPKNKKEDEQNINNQSENNNDENSKKHRRSRENRRRVRLSKNMPPKAKPVDDADEYDIEFLREIMNEKTRSGRKEKYELYKEKHKNESNEIEKDDENNCDDENEDVKFFFQNSEKDWDKIAYSESCSELDDSQISNKFTKRKENDEIIDNENELNNQKQTKTIDLSFEDNCFYFEREQIDYLPKENVVDVATEVHFESDILSKNYLSLNPNYYSFSIIIYGAKNVVKTDLITTCDPYCKLIIKENQILNEEEEIENAIISAQTKVADDTQNPEWNEKFTFNVENVKEKSISFLIFDNDTIGIDKLINSLTLPLEKFIKSNDDDDDDEWLTMKSKLQVGTLTDLHLSVKATPEFGSTKNVDFKCVKRTNIGTEIESNEFSPIRFDSSNDFDVKSLKALNEEEENENNSEDENERENKNELKSSGFNIIINEEESEIEKNNSMINSEVEEENKNDNQFINEEESKVENDKLNIIENEEESKNENNKFDFIENEEENKIENNENLIENEEENKNDNQFMNEEESKVENDKLDIIEIEEESEIENNKFDFIENEEESKNEIEVKNQSEEDEEQENSDNFINIDVDIDI